MKKARDRRDEMRKLVADGIDPSAARKQQKLMALDAAANTFEAVAREWFEKHSANWEASYSVKLLARLEANIFPWLGDRPSGDIKPPASVRVAPGHSQKWYSTERCPWPWPVISPSISSRKILFDCLEIHNSSSVEPSGATMCCV